MIEEDINAVDRTLNKLLTVLTQKKIITFQEKMDIQRYWM
jgi:hypothetical protein